MCTVSDLQVSRCEGKKKKSPPALDSNFKGGMSSELRGPQVQQDFESRWSISPLLNIRLHCEAFKPEMFFITSQKFFFSLLLHLGLFDCKCYHHNTLRLQQNSRVHSECVGIIIIVIILRSLVRDVFWFLSLLYLCNK